MADVVEIPGSYEVLLNADLAIEDRRIYDNLWEAQESVTDRNKLAEIMALGSTLGSMTSNGRVILDSIPTKPRFGLGFEPRAFNEEELAQARSKLTRMRNIVSAGTSIKIDDESLPQVADYDEDDVYYRPRDFIEWSHEVGGLTAETHRILSGLALKGILSFDDVDTTTVAVLTGLNVDDSVMQVTNGFTDIRGVPSGRLIVGNSPLTLLAAGFSREAYITEAKNRLAGLRLV